MSRIFALLFTVWMMVSLLGCGAPNDSDRLPTAAPTEASTEASTEAPTDAPAAPTLTIDDIVTAFEEKGGFLIQRYNDDQIAQIEGNLQLNGEILTVVHIVRSNGDGTNEWTYVYEMSDQSDADWLAQNREAFVQTLENGICLHSGKIVVYGNSDVIRLLNERESAS